MAEYKWRTERKINDCENCNEKNICEVQNTMNNFGFRCKMFSPYRPPSNADRIRSMTDEELAVEMTAKGGCPHDCEEPENMDTDCVKCWLDWLRQEVES